MAETEVMDVARVISEEFKISLDRALKIVEDMKRIRDESPSPFDTLLHCSRLKAKVVVNPEPWDGPSY